MKAMVVRTAKAAFVREDRPVPEPGPGEVRIRVHACGICHSDQLVKDALWPGLQLPRVPGHEAVGEVDAVGGDRDIDVLVQVLRDEREEGREDEVHASLLPARYGAASMRLSTTLAIAARSESPARVSS